MRDQRTSSARVRLRQSTAALAVALGVLVAGAMPVGAQQVDNRPRDQRPIRAHGGLGPKPDGVVPWTGTVSVSPEIGKVGDSFTVTYHQIPFGPYWQLDKMGGKCSGGPTKYTGKHLPLAEIGGYSSCTWVAKAPTGGWASVGAQIAGPCGDPDLVAQGRAEYAICEGIRATDHYAVLGEKENVIEGHVRGSEGDPVGGIRVEVKGTDTAFHQFTVTNGDGFYTMTVDKGSYLVRPSYFDDERFGGLAPDDFDPHDKTVSASGKTEVNFTVKGHRLSGHVKDPKGKGLAGQIIGIRSSRGVRTATTGGDGAYVMTVPAGSYAVDVETPRPPANITVNKIWDAPYRCTAAGAGPKDYFCKVDMSKDRENQNFEFNTDLSVDMKVTPTPDSSGRFQVTVQVSDSRRQPVGSQKVHFQPPGAVSPRALVCDGVGTRLYPANPTGDSDYISGDFDLTTDDQGRIEVWVWPGTQNGKWRIDAKIPGSYKTSEFASSGFNFPAGGATDSPTDAKAAAAVITALKASGTGLVIQNVIQAVPPDVHAVFAAFAGNPSAGVAMDILSTSLTSSTSFPYSVHPLRGGNGASGGLLVMPRQPDQALLKQVEAFLTGKAPAPNLYVLDAGALAKQLAGASISRQGNKAADPWTLVNVGMVRLADWPGQGAPAKGHPSAGADEAQFTYFGWPQRPAASTPLDKCAGIVSRGITAGKASPVRLVFTNAAGQRVGDAPAGSTDPLTEVPGSVVTKGPGDLVSYAMPQDSYTVAVTSTGSGKARVFLRTGPFNSDQWVYDLQAASGLHGTFHVGPQGADQTLDWGGQAVKVRRGLGLQVSGLPASISVGKHQTYVLNVKDELGRPVPFASLSVTTADYAVSMITDAEGKGEVVLYGVPENESLATKVAATGFVPVAGKIAIKKAGAAEVDSEIRAYLGPEQMVDLPGAPGFPWDRVIGPVVFVLAIVGGWFYLRDGQRRRRALATAGAAASRVLNGKKPDPASP